MRTEQQLQASLNEINDHKAASDEHVIVPFLNEDNKPRHYVAISGNLSERKRAEVPLKLFRALIDQSTDGFEIIDPKTGRFIDVNRTTSQRLGYKREELLSMSVPDIEAIAVDFSSWAKVVDEIRQAGFKIIEGRHKRKDGSTFPVEVNVRYVKLDHDYLVATVRDITERKEAERALKDSHIQLRALSARLSDFSVPGFDGHEALCLAHEKYPAIPFLFVSGTIGEDLAIEALKNGATDYVLKHRLLRLIPAVDRALREAAEHSECERAELAMRESEHKYREVFENLDEAAFLADQKTGRIIDTNRCAEKMLGCGRAEILGRQKSQFLADADKSKMDDPSPFECAMTRANGCTLPVHVHTTKIMIRERSFMLWLCRELTGL